ncbi:hypothetical protein [Endozoicomonas sp. ALB032]|uniref:hypothetical protein n=1 Tax=Endozoicomonas sp. ALB032 TaxID=3403082 RepID=UPI003BB74650
MNYGLPITTSFATRSCTATVATPQPLQYCASGSNANTETTKPPFKLNPKAPAFIPRMQPDQPVQKDPGVPSNILDRRAKAYQCMSPRTFQQRVNKSCPETAKRIDSAFKLLKKQDYINAEAAFRTILQDEQLNEFDHQRTVIGLARSLKEQTSEKKKEALTRLEELRVNGTFTESGASTIRNLDLTMSLCEQALGRFHDAQARLLRLRNKKPDADAETLCQHSGYFDVDIANARLWQHMRKYQLAEKLLLGMKAGLIEKLQSDPHAGIVERLHNYLDSVNIALVRYWQEQCQYDRAEDLLLNMGGKHLDESIETLCKPSGHHDIDLVRHWQVMGKYEWAEKLLLNMIGKDSKDSIEILCTASEHPEFDLSLALLWHATGRLQLSEKLLLNMISRHPDDAEEILCTASGKHEIDLALVRLWQEMGEYQRAEILLLNLSLKHPDEREESLCQPCGHHDIDLTLARLWQKLNKHKQAGILLLNMSGKRPDAAMEELCRPCGNRDIDLALALHWEIVNKHHLTEGLLLNMSNKDLNDSEDSLCMPCGNHDIDLALVRLWELIDKGKQAERLIERCCKLYHSDECELSYLSLSAGKAKFMEVINGYSESANKLLLISIHYFVMACKQISEASPKSGEENLIKALEHVQLTLERYPPTAGAYSQKAHCLRMLGANEQEWRKCFQKAQALDSNRKQKGKSDTWRSNEYAALQKVLAQT